MRSSHYIRAAAEGSMISVRVALDGRDQLGEGPFWDDRTGELLRVDITAGEVRGWSPSGGAAWVQRFAKEVSAVVPRASEAGWVIGAGHRILLHGRDGSQLLAAVEEDAPGNRFNDCKCDPQGRLWAGTMSKERTTGVASLYRLSPGEEIEPVVTGTTISNGLGWSPDGERMYFTDSTTQRIDVFDFDAEGGAISNRRAFAEIEPSAGLPDGLTVDAEGGVWVCLFGGAAIRRYDADGGLDAVVPLPVTNPTSPVFGGPQLTTLYVTSARHRLSRQQLAAEPQAGALLALEPRVAGLIGNRFCG